TNGEARAAALAAAFGVDAAFVQPHDLLDHREPEPEAARPGALPAVLIERLEDVLQRVRPDTSALIDDGEDGRIPVDRELERDAAAAVGVLECVVEQVVHDLSETHAVADDRHRLVGHRAVEAVACGRRAKSLDAL